MYWLPDEQRILVAKRSVTSIAASMGLLHPRGFNFMMRTLPAVCFSFIIPSLVTPQTTTSFNPVHFNQCISPPKRRTLELSFKTPQYIYTPLWDQDNSGYGIIILVLQAVFKLTLI